MTQTRVRPFTDAEREALEQELINQPPEVRTDYASVFGTGLLCATLCLVIGAGIAVLSKQFYLMLPWIGVSVAFGGSIVFGGWRDEMKIRAEQYSVTSAAKSLVMRRLRQGEMEEVDVVAYDYILLEGLTDGSRGYLLDVGDRRVLFLTCESFAGRASDGISSADLPGPPSAFRMSLYPNTSNNPVAIEATAPPLPRGRTTECVPWEGQFRSVNSTLFESVSLATIEAELPTLFGNEFDGFLPEGDQA